MWIIGRRNDRRRGILSKERIGALDALDMVWDPYDDDWQRGPVAARTYREAHGDIRVTYSHVTDDGVALGRWIAKRRTERRQERLSSERIAELDALDMVWEVRHPKNT